MKKISILVFMSFIFIVFSSFVFADTNDSDVNRLFEKYYYDGVYTKKTNINLNDKAVIEAIKYFHNQCAELERTTYYDGDKLWMTNDYGTINSGYGTNSSGMTHFYINEAGEEVIDYVVKGTSMEESYTTLYDFKDEKEVNWEMVNGTYVSYDDKAIQMFKDFCAPCFVGIDLNQYHWLIFSHVSVEEIANSLRMKLYVTTTQRGYLNNNNTVFAEALIYRGIDEIVYDEKEYVTDAVDNDLTLLKETFNSISDGYVAKTKAYFNPLATQQINQIYKMTFYDELTTIYTNDYMYRYSEDLYVNDVYYNYNNNVYKGSLDGYSLFDKLDSDVDFNSFELYLEDGVYSDNEFNLFKLDSTYIDTYGPIKINNDQYNGWIKISENIYKCDRLEVLDDFIDLCSPTFTNGGMYMTYKYVIVEVNPENGAALHIRLYASSTQSGKMLSSHFTKDYANWYLLSGEAYIYHINNAKVNALENIQFN